MYKKDKDDFTICSMKADTKVSGEETEGALTLYSANVTGSRKNCSYPNRIVVTDMEDLRSAVSHDYVCVEFKNCYRNSENFLSADCLPVDCDNDHSENPEDWVTPEDVQKVFSGVRFAIHYSRSNQREKNGKPARPKFHVIFPIDRVTDASLYCAMKRLVHSIFPYFDANALDAARFFFGTQNPDVAFYSGNRNLSEFLDDNEFDADLPGGRERDTVIPKGSRNATMSRFAAIIIKRYGDTEKAYRNFLEKATCCMPPLNDDELERIWHSAKRFYARISREKGYIPPEVYNDENSYKPEDFSDVGQAEVLSKYFSGELRYSLATLFLHYNGRYWQETESGAQAVAQELTRRQMKEASSNIMNAQKKLDITGAQKILEGASGYRAGKMLQGKQMEAYQEFLDARDYKNFVIRRRDSRNIASTLKEARPMLEILPGDLDTNEFLLCTPDATYDLRKGMSSARKHSPEDFITKITSVSPGDKGQRLWLDTLDLIFTKDRQLIDYVQMICGLAAIGKVFVEALIIAYGDGRNGKSTFWNTISHVLGLYSGNISADALTVGCRRNIKPEMAEIRGKRLLIASEMQEGARLNDSIVKQLCSTDDVFAEKKYKDPFSFKPCHTLVLYTNHLPRVGASDDGIWRRLIVIPFCAKIDGKNDIKNYSEYLYENAGESILAWIIEGARKVIELGYHIPVPDCVEKAIGKYREQNDWFGHFLEDRCEIGDSFRESSSALYQAYRSYSLDCNEYVRNTADFYFSMEKAGFKRMTVNRKQYFKGLRILRDNDAEEDFLQ